MILPKQKLKFIKTIMYWAEKLADLKKSTV